MLDIFLSTYDTDMRTCV